MNWLVDNPIANLPGPDFLAFYILVCFVTLLLCWGIRRSADPAGALPPLPIPSEPDPYEVAYLRGGANEVTRTAIFTLLQRGYLQPTVHPNPLLRVFSSQWLERSPKAPDARHLASIEQRVWEWVTVPRDPTEAFRSGGLASQIEPLCAAYERRLRDEQLLATPSMVGAAWRAGLLGALVILGLGSYKLAIALSRGRTNVLFLIAVAIVSTIILIGVLNIPRQSRRGRKYLEQLQLAFEQYRQRVGRLTASAVDPILPLLVGLFGVSVLAGTPFDYYQQMFHRAASSSSCGGGCGSCGGGSSCSGGSCGGGCGGCGGGGD